MQILIAVLSAWGAYVLLDNLPEFQVGGTSELSSTWLPILVVLFFAYAIASGFMMVFDLSVDSVLVCFCTDIDENKKRNGDAGNFPIHVESDMFSIKAKMAAADAEKAAKGKGAKGVEATAGSNPIHAAKGAAPKV